MVRVPPLIRFEVLRWARSRRLVIVCVAFAFSGLSAPLVAAYAEEIFGTLQPASNMSIVVETPTWKEGVASYLKNASQLSLLFACYLAAWACSLGPDQRLQIFYLSRATTQWRVLAPRLVVSGLCVLLAASLGGLLALYEVRLLFEGTVTTRVLLVLAVQAVGLVTVALLAGIAASLTNAPAVSALVTYLVIFVLDLFREVDAVAGWTPIGLVRPDALLEGGVVSGYLLPGLVALGLVVVSGWLTLRRSVRPMVRGHG